MEKEIIKKEKYISVSENTLLSLVSAKLKERVLFPKKIEATKDFLKNVQVKPLKKV